MHADTPAASQYLHLPWPSSLAEAAHVHECTHTHAHNVIHCFYGGQQVIPDQLKLLEGKD